MSNIIKLSDYSGLTLKQTLEACKSVRTIQDLHSIEVPTLRFMMVQHGEKKILAFVKLSISNTLDFLNLKMTMSDNQIQRTAELILEVYNWLTIPDITICFKKAMLGDYGKLYAAIDGQIILQWFKQYASDRGDEIEEINIRLHSERKNNDEPIHPEILEAFKSVLKAKEESKNEFRYPELSELEQECFEAFEKLNKEQKQFLPDSRIPMVLYNEKHHTQESFIRAHYKDRCEELKKESEKKKMEVLADNNKH